jgi:multiple sugar transport system substrate-binding protein
VSARARTHAVASALLLATGLGGCRPASHDVVLRFWAMGHEGEVVQPMVRDWEAQHPGVRVEVQQIPWGAAHEKLLTAFVGRASPDLSQLGNSWIAEFEELHALQPLDGRIARSAVVARAHDFPGIWDTNVVDGVTWGVPWYVDTRLLFYRRDLLRAAGHDSMPQSWPEWQDAMRAIVRRGGPGRTALLLPVNEWEQPVILALQCGAPLLGAGATRGAFEEPRFRRAFAFYLSLFRDGLSPPVSNNQIANIYQEFARGTFAMDITGPWNLDEFRKRMPDSLQDAWSTAPMPGPDGAASGLSMAGGSSLVLFRGSAHPELAWSLLEYLSRPEQQLRFWQLSGDLPARRAAWQDATLQGDPRARAFMVQLGRVTSPPRLPEWEQIAQLVQQHAETAVRGAATPDQALAALDRDADRVLEKRRWLVQHARGGAGGGAAR